MPEALPSITGEMASVVYTAITFFETILRNSGKNVEDVLDFHVKTLCDGLIQVFVTFLVERQDKNSDAWHQITALLFDRSVLLPQPLRDRTKPWQRPQKLEPKPDYVLLAHSLRRNSTYGGDRSEFRTCVMYDPYWQFDFSGRISGTHSKPIPQSDLGLVCLNRTWPIPVVWEEPAKGVLKIIRGTYRRRNRSGSYYRVAMNPPKLEWREKVVEEREFQTTREYFIAQRFIELRRDALGSAAAALEHDKECAALPELGA